MVGILQTDEFEKLVPGLDEVVKLLNGLINYHEKSTLK